MIFYLTALSGRPGAIALAHKRTNPMFPHFKSLSWRAAQPNTDQVTPEDVWYHGSFSTLREIASSSQHFLTQVRQAFCVPKGKTKPSAYDPMQWMWHVGAQNITPTYLRNSAVTNRVLDYNKKIGIARLLAYEDARALLSALGNSGQRGSSEDIVSRYSWEPMTNHLVADADDDEDSDEEVINRSVIDAYYAQDAGESQAY